MDVAAVLLNAFGATVFFCGIGLWIYLDQQGKTRRRQLEHAERMRAIELGRPLTDGVVARYHALGAVGVAVPVAGLSAAVMASAFILLARDFEGRLWGLLAVWGACAVICGVTLPVVVARLREPPPPSRPLPEDGPGSRSAGLPEVRRPSGEQGIRPA